MVKHIIDADQTTTYNIAENNDSWELTEGTQITVQDETALLISGNGNKFVNFGSVATDNNQPEDLGYINAVNITGDDTTIINHGAMGGGYYAKGIAGAGGNLTLTNWGTISGRAGVSYDAGEGVIKFINQKDAHIDSLADSANYHAGVYLSGGEVTAINRGTIDGIHITGDAATLTNEGTLSGYVQIGGKHASLMNHGIIEHATIEIDGNNTFDARTGTLDDVSLLGGIGNQIFQIDHAMTIAGGTGRDTVQAQCTYKLADGSGIENLVLLGKKGFRAAGGDENNTITGNNGNNRLAGGGGEDKLTGGKGHDEFVFNANSDHDTISDFTDGIDKIHIDGYKFITFSALAHRIEQDGHDVVIAVSKDHTIVLEHFKASNLDAHDFMFS
jgi:Ca2+-binding RTX toxin-like protein